MLRTVAEVSRLKPGEIGRYAPLDELHLEDRNKGLEALGSYFVANSLEEDNSELAGHYLIKFDNGFRASFAVKGLVTGAYED
jgi:hypothetical protein